jgi:hypothetical protein
MEMHHSKDATKSKKKPTATKTKIKDQRLYKALPLKIAMYLDGNAEVIQSAVQEYFLIEHCKVGLGECLFTWTNPVLNLLFMKARVVSNT